MSKKRIGVMIPCFNEEENVVDIGNAISKEISTNLPEYDYEIIAVNDCSPDGVLEVLKTI